jgi:hypothetical protein
MSVGQSVSVLDIGGNIGALILYTDEQRDREEIDIVNLLHPDRGTHSQVHRRTANGRTIWAAVYPQLSAGTYRLRRADTAADDVVTIEGGRITELDWRDHAATQRERGRYGI